MSMSICVNNIQRFSLHDGPGIRTTVFLQGCPLRCWWCHNPETREADGAAAREIEIPELVAELERDAPYWAESGGGVTLSGGEPLAQAAAALALTEALRGRGGHVALDTCGVGSDEDVRALGAVASLWLWDIKAVSPDLARRGTGNDLSAALDNLTRVLDATGTPVIVRVPLIAGFNAERGELEAMAEWLAARRRRVPVEILPGHRHGVADEGLRSGRVAPSPEEVELARAVFEGTGFEVRCPARRRR
jgi:pyruvate formate lyase activating enzyme